MVISAAPISISMKHFLPVLISLFLLPSMVLASSPLLVSQSSDFSSDVRDFSAGQTIYVKIETDNSGDNQKVLNLRDNSYNLLKTYPLNKSGSVYTVSFGAPSGDGYYSLEAKIESSGQNTTSVKTVKVGSVNAASVKVNVNSKTEGQSRAGGSAESGVVENEGNEGNSDKGESPVLSPAPEVQSQTQPGIKQPSKIWHFLTKVLVFVFAPLRIF